MYILSSIESECTFSLGSLAEMLFPLKETNDIDLTEFTDSQRFDNELSVYLKAKIESHVDPHDWWATNKVEMPRLTLLANRFLSAPPSSIESERTFSLGGCTYIPERSKLLPETGSKLIELGFNMRHFIDLQDETNPVSLPECCNANK